MPALQGVEKPEAGGLLLYSFNPRMLPDDQCPKPVYRKLLARPETEVVVKVQRKRKSRSVEDSPESNKEQPKKKSRKKKVKEEVKQTRKSLSETSLR